MEYATGGEFGKRVALPLPSPRSPFGMPAAALAAVVAAVAAISTSVQGGSSGCRSRELPPGE